MFRRTTNRKAVSTAERNSVINYAKRDTRYVFTAPKVNSSKYKRPFDSPTFPFPFLKTSASGERKTSVKKKKRSRRGFHGVSIENYANAVSVSAEKLIFMASVRIFLKTPRI